MTDTPWLTFRSSHPGILSNGYAPQKTTWHLSTISGHQISNGISQNGDIRINVADLFSGLYLLQLTNSEGHKQVHKVIVN